MSDGIVIIGDKLVEYNISNLIESNNEQYDAMQADPEKYEPLKLDGMQRLSKDTDVYPKDDRYTFQEFAGPVFEMGGYGDITMINPYTLDRLWISSAFVGDASLWDAMRLAITVAEEIGFMEKPDTE